MYKLTIFNNTKFGVVRHFKRSSLAQAFGSKDGRGTECTQNCAGNKLHTKIRAQLSKICHDQPAIVILMVEPPTHEKFHKVLPKKDTDSVVQVVLLADQQSLSAEERTRRKDQCVQALMRQSPPGTMMKVIYKTPDDDDQVFGRMICEWVRLKDENAKAFWNSIRDWFKTPRQIHDTEDVPLSTKNADGCAVLPLEIDTSNTLRPAKPLLPPHPGTLVMA